jgi:peptide/nickel transport system permease protein
MSKSRWNEFKTGIAPSIKEWKFMLSRLKKSPLSLVGLAILIFYVSLALLAPVLAPPNPSWALYRSYDPFRIPRESYMNTPDPPSALHPFGTTEQQYDIFYGVMWGTITAFRVGLWVVAASLFIGVVVGVVAGYYGGVVDDLMMRFTDVIIAFPGLILAMALVAALGQSLDNVMLALILVGWPGYTRVVRGEVLRVKQEDYVEAAKASGCSDLRVIVKHILPNAIYPVVIMASLDTGAIVLAAAALSFLGLGAPPDFADWGQMISRSQNWIFGNPQNAFAYWHTFVIPGIFIFIFVLGWNLLGDAFRDILDPTLRRR